MRWYATVVFSVVVVVCVLLPQQGFAYTPESIGRAIVALIPEAPVMVGIARCESGLRQFDEHGAVLRGGLGGTMVGVFQLHEKYHRSAARARGHNIDTLLGNIGYARELYRSEGSTPWLSSEDCWNIAHTLSQISQSASGDTGTTSHAVLTKTLRYGATDREVALLQRFLNRAGHKVVQEGKETVYFGIATMRALTAFQCAQGIGCVFAPRSEYGHVGPRTRAALSAT